MNFSVTQNSAPCGAIVEGIDLTKPLKDLDIKALRKVWLKNHILVFPNQLLSDDESRDLLFEVYNWQTREEFIYTHQWQEHMLVMWDNRSLLHKANGGYDGHERLLHRTTIAEQTT